MKKLCLWLIRWYQRNISSRTPPRCRFYPTCSQYTYTAIERFGVLRGTLMGLWRILRCNPFSRGGYDPVPEKKLRDTLNQGVAVDSAPRKSVSERCQNRLIQRFLRIQKKDATQTTDHPQSEKPAE